MNPLIKLILHAIFCSFMPFHHHSDIERTLIEDCVEWKMHSYEQEMEEYGEDRIKDVVENAKKDLEAIEEGASLR